MKAGVETLRGGSAGDTLSGDSQANRLEGGPGGDTLQSDAGNDQLDGGPGDDQILAGAAPDGGDPISGGDGHDTADYSLRTKPLRIALGDAVDDGEFVSGVPGARVPRTSSRGAAASPGLG